MQNISNDEFLTDVEEFLNRSGMSPSAFGKAAMGDPNFVFDVRAGRSPSLNAVAQVAAFINGWEG